MEILFVWIGCALIGALIGKYKGRVGSGVVWALVLGPIGWLIVALMQDLREKCPECGGVVVPGARKCKHCGSATGDVQYQQWKQKQDELRQQSMRR